MYELTKLANFFGDLVDLAWASIALGKNPEVYAICPKYKTRGAEVRYVYQVCDDFYVFFKILITYLLIIYSS